MTVQRSLACWLAALWALAGVGLAAAVLAPAASAADAPQSIVIFESSTPPAARARIVHAAGGRVVRDLHLINGLGAAMPRVAARRLARQRGVLSVIPNAAVRPSAVAPGRAAAPAAAPVGPSPSSATAAGAPAGDPAQCAGLWASWCPGALATAFVQSTRADRAWADERHRATGRGVGVAVIDTGIAGDLPDFRAPDGSSRVIASAVVNPDAKTADDRYGHGTHVAGLLAGNGRQLDPADPLYNRYIGTAPDAHLVSIKASDDRGYATVMDVIDGLQFAVDFKDEYGIRVVNLSLNSSEPRSYLTDPLDAAAEAAWFSGLVVVTAAGNRGAEPGAVSYAPANDPFVISVGGVNDQATKETNDDAVAAWSSRGVTQDGFSKPDVVAPGAHMVAPLAPDSLFTELCSSCVVRSRYFQVSGTSMASPVVAGIAAGLLSAHPRWTPDMVKQALAQNVRPVQGQGGEVAADIALYDRLPKVTANAGLAPSRLLDPDSLAIDYTRASWGRATWGAAGDLLRASWGRASWGCELCGGGAAVDATRASWGRASWGDAAWASFFGEVPEEYGELRGGKSGAVPAAPRGATVRPLTY